MTVHKMSDRGLLALARHEGLVPAPYLDVKSVWTFGIGHTAAAGAPDPARMPRGMPADLDAAIREAFRLFRADLARYEAEVARAVTVPLEPHEFDALVSFHYNTGAIARATLTRLLNAGDRKGAAAAFLNWVKPTAIVPRREAERDLFRDGRYPGGTIPVWAVDTRGRVDFSRPVRSLTAEAALALLNAGAVPPKASVFSPAAVATSQIQATTEPAQPVAPATAAAWFPRVLTFLTQLLRRS
jgi:lysozyme